MTQSQQPTDRPGHRRGDRPGEGPEAGSVEYGGSEIHEDGAGWRGRDGYGPPPAGGRGRTRHDEAGTFEELPVTAEEQGD